MKKTLLLIFFAGTAIMMMVMSNTGASLKTKAAPLGILNLEFAYNTSKTAPILESWTPSDSGDNIIAAKTNTYWDFLFLFFYAGFLFLACKKIAEKFNGSFSNAGILIAKGALLAGVLDILENAGMLLTLNGQGSSTVAFLTTFFSVIKWGLAIIAVLYALTGLLVQVFRRK